MSNNKLHNDYKKLWSGGYINHEDVVKAGIVKNRWRIYRLFDNKFSNIKADEFEQLKKLIKRRNKINKGNTINEKSI